MRMQNSTKKVIAALIIKDEKVLIACRTKDDINKGKWEFPGGKQDQGELDEQTLTRELYEEFGIKADIGSYVCSSFFEYKSLNYEMKAYKVYNFTGSITLTEHSEIKWVSRNELPLYDMPDPDKPIVQELLLLDSW